jgi:formylglycine-generating enzyme required for sulfatase activity
MAGNVFEWVQDWYDAYPGSTFKLPGFGRNYKVIRGGGFDGAPYDAATVHRAILPPRVRSQWAGFRCVRSVEPETVRTTNGAAADNAANR